MIELIGVPIYVGADIRGGELAPDKIRSVLSSYKYIDAGDCIVPSIDNKEDVIMDNMKYKNIVISACTNLLLMTKSVISRGHIPLVVGGDHSLSLGSIPATSYTYDNLGVVYLDAHGDINTHITSPTGHIHGMTMAAAMGIGHQDLVNVASGGKMVKEKNVFFLGTRSLDPGEKKLVKERGLNVRSMQQIREHGIENTLQWLGDKIVANRISHLHFSIDLDVLDPGIAPGTGVKEKNGMDYAEFFAVLNFVLNTQLVRTVDLVEYNPLLDKDNATLKICLDIVDLLVKRLNG